MRDFSGEKLESRIADYHEEIRRLVQEERQEGKTAHFFLYPDFAVEDLNEDDMNMWKAVKSSLVTPESFDVYQRSVVGFRENKPTFKKLPNVPQSRAYFMGFLANKAMTAFLEKE